MSSLVASAAALSAPRSSSERGTPDAGPRRSGGYDASYRRLRAIVLRRDGDECTYCGRPATTVDHVIPLADGGANSLDNLVAACRWCNSSRGGRQNRRTT